MPFCCLPQFHFKRFNINFMTGHQLGAALGPSLAGMAAILVPSPVHRGGQAGLLERSVIVPKSSAFNSDPLLCGCVFSQKIVLLS